MLNKFPKPLTCVFCTLYIISYCAILCLYFVTFTRACCCVVTVRACIVDVKQRHNKFNIPPEDSPLAPSASAISLSESEDLSGRLTYNSDENIGSMILRSDYFTRRCWLR